jgi:L-lysine 6-transaminase
MKIKIDFEKSKNSYIYDKNTEKLYLDFFGQYSSLAIGYNNDIFDKSFENEVSNIIKNKISNSATYSDEEIEFKLKFKNFCSKNIFNEVYFCCTGSLAVESAVKAAFDYKQFENPEIITFSGSFHGVNSFSCSLTDRFEPVNQRLDGYPKKYGHLINYNPNINNINDCIEKIKHIIEEQKNIAGILIEPIQCTYGDRYYPYNFFKKIREICTHYDVPMIFDEIQTGFGVTGKLWYFEHIDIIPDIVIFGKKAQLSGFMIQDKFSKIFENHTKLEVTWNSTIIDMIRSKYIINYFIKNKLLENVNRISNLFYNGLNNLENICNLRITGFLIAFDLESKNKRDLFNKLLNENGIICNPTRDITIRFRPPLNLSESDAIKAIKIITNINKLL